MRERFKEWREAALDLAVILLLCVEFVWILDIIHS